MQTSLALWNGEIRPLADVTVPVLDRGWLFGDAVYEVVRLYGGRPFLLAEHEQRLARSLAGLGITAPLGSLAAKIARLLDAGADRDGMVYVQVSRGVGPRSHVPPKGMIPNELVYVQSVDEGPLEAKRRGGISVATVADRRWGRCDLKTVNLLGNVLAAEEAKARGADEALLVDQQGLVTEGTHASFFGVRRGELVTTPLSERLLPGVTRAFLIDRARKAGLVVREEALPAGGLAALDEAFLSGTITEVMPIVRVDGRAVGSGAVGPVTQRMRRALRLAATGAPGEGAT